MKKRLSFKREILERIDYFNYLNPDSLCDSCPSKEKNKEEEQDEEASEEDISNHKRYSKPVDVRKYLQYVNVKSD